MFLSLLLLLFAFTALPPLRRRMKDVRGAFLPRGQKQTTMQINLPLSPVTGDRNRRLGRRREQSPVVAQVPARQKKRCHAWAWALTLFMRDSNGLAVRTDPSHAFHKGDHVRVLLETIPTAIFTCSIQQITVNRA